MPATPKFEAILVSRTLGAASLLVSRTRDLVRGSRGEGARCASELLGATVHVLTEIQPAAARLRPAKVSDRFHILLSELIAVQTAEVNKWDDLLRQWQDRVFEWKQEFRS